LSEIAAGSVVEIGGAFFNFPADEVINASSWGSITSGNTAYIALVPAGTAGSQTVTAEFIATAPVWRDDSQGWYASAASTTRVIASVYKVSATAQTQKYLYSPLQNGKQKDISVITASVASSLSVGGAASVASSLTINGNVVPPYKATTQTWTKTIANTTLVELTTPSSVYTINGGYMTLSSAPTSQRIATLYFSSGTIYGAQDFVSVTSVTFVVNYWY
jgi:hypothetical protein